MPFKIKYVPLPDIAASLVYMQYTCSWRSTVYSGSSVSPPCWWCGRSVRSYHTPNKNFRCEQKKSPLKQGPSCQEAAHKEICSSGKWCKSHQAFTMAIQFQKFILTMYCLKDTASWQQKSNLNHWEVKKKNKNIQFSFPLKGLIYIFFNLLVWMNGFGCPEGAPGSVVGSGRVGRTGMVR